MSDQPIKRILVELDCLLDTRVATVHRINPQAAVKLIDSPYFYRQVDDFEALTQGLIEQSDYKVAYERRDIDTLKCARPTKMLGFLHTLNGEIVQQSLRTPHSEGFCVEVNTYPYQLSESEKRALCLSVKSYLKPDARVTAVFFNPKDITPERFLKHWDAIVVYDFNTWFQHHCNAFNHFILPRHLVFAPALYLYRIPDEEEAVVEGFENLTPFGWMEKACVERFSLEFLSASEFSLVDPALLQ